MKALLVVDVQNDFFEDGSLPVPDSYQIIPVINNLIEIFDFKVFTQDWHPPNHKSFASNHPGKEVFDVIKLNGIDQILWPDHCVQESQGSQFQEDIKIPGDAPVFKKGKDPEVDSYSGFFDNKKGHSTGLGDFLKEKGVDEVFICGLAADVCVKFTALDSVELGFQTNLIADGTAAVNMNLDDYDKALIEMNKKGVNIYTSDELS